MNVSLTNLPCPGYIRGTCCSYISQLNFVSVIFYMSSKTTWRRCILKSGSAQAWAGSSAPCWPLEWRKQKLLLLPPCLHFCPYFLKYILHYHLCPTSPETIVCQKWCGFDCFCQGVKTSFQPQAVLTFPYTLLRRDTFLIFLPWKLPLKFRVSLALCQDGQLQTLVTLPKIIELPRFEKTPWDHHPTLLPRKIQI